MPTSGYAQNLLWQCQVAGLPLPVPEYRFHATRRWRLDFCWPDRKLYVEVDGGTWIGGRHNRGAGFEKDAEKLNAACLEGYRGLRFTTRMVKDGRALSTLQEALKPSSSVIR